MKVYLVTDGYDDDFVEAVAVFSTKELAEKAVSDGIGSRVEEFEVDKLALPVGHGFYRVSMKENGAGAQVTRATYGINQPPVLNRYVWQSEYRSFSGVFAAKSEYDALKQARKALREILDAERADPELKAEEAKRKREARSFARLHKKVEMQVAGRKHADLGLAPHSVQQTLDGDWYVADGTGLKVSEFMDEKRAREMLAQIKRN